VPFAHRRRGARHRDAQPRRIAVVIRLTLLVLIAAAVRLSRKDVTPTTSNPEDVYGTPPD